MPMPFGASMSLSRVSRLPDFSSRSTKPTDMAAHHLEAGSGLKRSPCVNAERESSAATPLASGLT